MIGKYPRTKAIRAERRARAESLLAFRGEISPEVQLAHLDRMGFRALKERAKLAKKILLAKQKQGMHNVCTNAAMNAAVVSESLKASKK